MSQIHPATAAPGAAEPGAPVASPYRGLTPYTEDDYAYFFGREQETNAISANLEVARFTLFYGPSGVGKSSVLRAGVLHQLQQRAAANAAANAADGRPEFIPVYFNRWQQEPVQGLSQAVAAAAQPYLPDAAMSPPDGPLLAQLQGWSQATGSDLLLILDQFEEYFLYQNPASASDPASFGAQLVQIANHSSLRVNLLISLREDALARLDYFKGRIPFLLDNRLSIGHLKRGAGQQAVEAPLAQYNREYTTAYTIEPQLVEAVLDQVGSGTITLGRQSSGSRRPEGTELAAQSGDLIEAPYLQLVLTRLWEKETGQSSSCLRLSTLDDLGGAEAIVRNHLDNTLDSLAAAEQALAARFLDRLVTPSGAKIALSLAELTGYAGAPQPQVEAVIRILEESRLLRGVQTPDGGTRYEILHDVLGPALLDWHGRFQKTLEEEARLAQAQKARAAAEAEARVAEERARLQEMAASEAQRRVRQARLALVGLSLLLLLALGAVGWAVSAQNNAKQRAQEANEASVAAEVARTEADSSAAEAERQKQNAETARAEAQTNASEAERQAGIALAAAARADERAAAADLASRRALAESMAGYSQLLIHRDHLYDDRSLILARDAALLGESPNSYTALRTAVDNARSLLVIPSPASRHLGAVNAVAFSPDGQRIVSGGADGTIRLWRAGDMQPLQLLFGHTGRVLSVGFSPDGQRIVSAGFDSSVRVWDVASGEEVSRLEGHTGRVWSVGFSPDGERIVSAGDDSSVRVWESARRLLLRAIAAIARPAPILTTTERQRLGLAGESRLPAQTELLPLMRQAQAQEAIDAGRGLAGTGRVDEAIAQFETALALGARLTLDPQALAETIRANQTQALIFAGAQLAGAGEPDKALLKLAEAVALDASLTMTQAQQRAAIPLLQEGRKLVRIGQIEDGLRLLERAIALDSGLELETLVREGLVDAQLQFQHCGLLAFAELAALVSDFCDELTAQVTEIEAGKGVTGTIDTIVGDLWRLPIVASSHITITLAAEGGDSDQLDTYLTLYNAEFRIVDENDDLASGGLDSELVNVPLTESGIYWIEAGRCCPNGDNGSVGGYRLRVVVRLDE